MVVEQVGEARRKEILNVMVGGDQQDEQSKYGAVGVALNQRGQEAVGEHEKEEKLGASSEISFLKMPSDIWNLLNYKYTEVL